MAQEKVLPVIDAKSYIGSRRSPRGSTNRLDAGHRFDRSVRERQWLDWGWRRMGSMARQEQSNTADPPEIPDHKMVRRIATGAYGEVWLARNILGSFRAVKIVRRSTFDDERPFQREFEGMREFEPVSRAHPGFVVILQVGHREADGYFFYVMELADDLVRQRDIQAESYAPRTLSAEVAQRGRLPGAECLQIGIELSSALACLHSRGLIHRDIKPSNIIYVEGTPRLADIGLVTRIRDLPSAVGTFGYSPSEGPGTVSADIYGLGKLLYHILAGNAVDRYPCLPTDLVDAPDWPSVSRLNDVIAKACAPQPQHRFTTADDLHQALLALRPHHEATRTEAPARTSNPSVPNPDQKQIVVLSRQGIEPDGRLLRFLKQRLSAQGVGVYHDEHHVIGLEWALRIEERIRAADAILLLCSEASIHSEMLTYELEMAHQASQAQGGRPLRLPVRVQYTAPWPESVQPFLESLPSLSWNGPGDDERLVDGIVRTLRTTQKPPARLPATQIEPAGGAVDLRSEFYVIRPTDHAFRDAVSRRDSIVLVKGARQMGKTSLLARGLHQARQEGARVALCDFQKLGLSDLESAESFYLALAGFLADQLSLESPEVSWERRRSPNVNFERFLRREALGKIEGHLVWGLDEIDRLFAREFGSDVFALFRSWHNERALDPTGPWSRLTLAIAYATEAHLFITDVNQSPFNVGTRVDLEDFTLHQVRDLNARHGSPLEPETQLPRFHRLLGGQPYLTRLALNELTTGRVTFDQLMAEADRDEGVFGDHLRRILVMLSKDPELRDIVRQVVDGESGLDAATFYRLRSGGVMRGDSAAEARPRCEIYTSYLRRHLH